MACESALPNCQRTGYRIQTLFVVTVQSYFLQYYPAFSGVTCTEIGRRVRIGHNWVIRGPKPDCFGLLSCLIPLCCNGPIGGPDSPLPAAHKHLLPLVIRRLKAIRLVDSSARPLGFEICFGFRISDLRFPCRAGGEGLSPAPRLPAPCSLLPIPRSTLTPADPAPRACPDAGCKDW